MADQDQLVEVVETTVISVDVPAEFNIVVENILPHNVVELEVQSVPVTIDGEGPPEFHLQLMDGDLFVAENDGMLGTRLRQVTNTLVANTTIFGIPAVATRIYGFSVNGIDYVENVELTLGQGVVTFTAGIDGYSPRTGDFVAITYSE